jgi:hypothetical protein
MLKLPKRNVNDSASLFCFENKDFEREEIFFMNDNEVCGRYRKSSVSVFGHGNRTILPG